MYKDSNLCPQMKKWFVVGWIGVGLLGGRNLDGGCQETQTPMAGVRFGQGLEGGQHNAQCISEKSIPGRKGSLTKHEVGDGRMAGVCSRNPKEAIVGGVGQAGMRSTGVRHGAGVVWGADHTGLCGLCGNDTVFHWVSHWEQWQGHEHRDGILPVV